MQLPIKSVKQLTFASLMLGLTLLPLQAASAAGLGDIIQTTLERRPEYRVSQSRQAVAEGFNQQSRSLLAGDTAVTLRHKNDSLGSDNGLSEWGAGLEMPLWLPGQKSSYRELAQSLDTEALAAHKLLAWQVAGEVRERAWALRLAESARDLAQEQLKAAQALEREVERRRNAGELADSDWILARQETLSRRAMLQEAETGVINAHKAWETYTGLSLLPEPLSEQVEQAADFPASHPRVLEAVSRVNRQRAERERQRIERRASPVLSLSANHERGDSNLDYDNSLELSISLPLGSRSHAAPRLAEAEAALTESEAAHQLALIELESEAAQARLALEQTTTAVTLAEEREGLAAKGAHLANRAFELGESDLVTLLRARNQAADAAIDLQRKRLEHQRAIARHNQIHGVIPK